jgi:hypothetical protein
MPIKYALFENKLTAEPDTYAAQVQTVSSYNLEAIMRRIVDQGSTCTEADILAVLEDAIKACENLLLEGGRVNFGGLVELYPRVVGVFNGITDSFEATRHRVDVGAKAGSRLRKAVRERAKLHKNETIKPAPAPLEYVDLGSGEVNGVITPGNIGTVNGRRLRYNPDAPDEGVFFIPTSGDPETRITAFERNKPGQLVFLVPGALPGGSYYLEIRARMTNSTELRAGRLDGLLHVSMAPPI